MKILIIDDEAVVGTRLKRLLRCLPDVTVVNYRSQKEEAILALIELQPDLLILDHHFPNGTGHDIARNVLRYSPATEVILFSALMTHQDITRYEDTGVRKFIDKTTGLEDLIQTVQHHAYRHRYRKSGAHDHA